MLKEAKASEGEIKNLRAHVEDLKVYPEFPLFMLGLEEEYVLYRLRLLSSYLKECEETITKLKRQRDKIEERIDCIRGTFFYRILKFLQPIIGSIWIVREVDELSASLADIKESIIKAKNNITSLSFQRFKLKHVLRMIKSSKNNIIHEEKDYLESEIKLWTAVINRLNEQVRRLLELVKRPRVGIDSELRQLCEREECKYLILKEGLQILRKKCRYYPDLFLQPEFLFKKLEEIGDLLEESKKVANTYIVVISHPNIRKAYLEVAENARSDLYIASPYISPEILADLLDRVKKEVSVKIIVRRVDDYEKVRNITKNMANVKIRLGEDVHCKLLINESEVIISSSNISKQGFDVWHEIGVRTNDPNIVNQAKMFFLELWGERKSYKEKYYGKGEISMDGPIQTAFISSYKNIPQLLFDILNRAKKRIVIVSPYLNYGAIKKLLSYVSKDVKITIITRITRQDLVMGLTDPEAITYILDRCKDVWNDPKLHAKVLLIDDRFAIISSLNITDKGLTKNFEAGILTQNITLINVVEKFVSGLRIKRLNTKDLEQEFEASLSTICERHEPEQPRLTTEIEKIPPLPPPVGANLKLPRIRVPLRRRFTGVRGRDKTSKEKGGRVKKKPVPIDLRILEQAFIIAILRLGGRCKLNELLNEVERRVAPKFIYFPWKLQGPRSLAGKSWRDRLVLESCLKFLTEKGLYQIQLSIEGDNVFVKPANIKVFKDFMERFSHFFEGVMK